ncbi:MAG: hypothetical protein SFV22_02380 [Saprospiraceae bacterium]|nr:hypothetical protein [Saprospiraceae bacterium]
MNEQLEHLAAMRNLMERSTRFLSLSGLSGVWAGACALVGAYFVRYYLDAQFVRDFNDVYYERGGPVTAREYEMLLVLTALAVLAAALAGGWFFTARKAKKRGERVWEASSRRLLWALAVPLTTGGVFCLALLYWNLIGLVAPATLVFYGLALFNGSKFTLRDVGSLGICQIVLGLTGLFYPGYGLELWSLGFGVLHILYGGWMWIRYDHIAAR